ncbi:hypothetical protein ACFPYI_14825 [Halomarina salina]|uniref:Lipoprotein n=1 Tax=Halomarina salina TaxID=1872699 RepID=A0ABD5RQP2_9EURY|nr:hypothetical protein [Halomarina salina]
MKRRALLGLSGAVLSGLAGCSTGATDSSGAPKRVATGPAGGCQSKITAQQYPDPPSTLTEERVVEFVKRYERAQIINQSAGDHGSLSVRITVESVSQTDDGWLIQLGGGMSQEGCGDGNSYVSDGIVAAHYFVNETAVYRADTFAETAGDPRQNGTKVA